MYHLPENNYNCQNKNNQFNIFLVNVDLRIHDYFFLCDSDTLVFSKWFPLISLP